LAAGSVALSKDEKNLGVALVDIGGGSTTIAVFEQNHLYATTVLPVGGEHITKDLSIGLRTTTDEAERIKVKYGHAYYDHASEDEVFEVSIIGSDQKRTFNQLEIADIIEARLEEMYELILHEIRRLGVGELPGGFVLTGGTVRMPGVLELGQVILQNSVRIASPDYIGVREPQYMTGVGLIQFAHKNAKIQGRKIGSNVAVNAMEVAATNEPQQQRTKPQQQQQDKKVNKVKKFFGYFFE
jgi:cell division protein FtsA